MVGRCFVTVGQSVQRLRLKNAFVFGNPVSNFRSLHAAHKLEGFHRLNLVDLTAIDVRGGWQGFKTIGVRDL